MEENHPQSLLDDTTCPASAFCKLCNLITFCGSQAGTTDVEELNHLRKPTLMVLSSEWQSLHGVSSAFFLLTQPDIRSGQWNDAEDHIRLV